MNLIFSILIHNQTQYKIYNVQFLSECTYSVEFPLQIIDLSLK
jgi:hypothetical protein